MITTLNGLELTAIPAAPFRCTQAIDIIRSDMGRVLLLALLCAAPGLSEVLTIGVTNIPAAADRVSVALDSAGITNLITAEQVFTPGTSTTTVTMNVPPGYPFRARVIAYNGTAQYGAVLRDGMAAVSAIATGGSASVTINLGDIVVTPDAANPASAPAGTTVTMLFHISDPGAAVEDAILVGLNYTGSTVTVDNGNSLIGTGTISNAGNGMYLATVSSTLGISPILLAYNLIVRMHWGTNTPELYAPPVGSSPFLLNITAPATVTVNITNIPPTTTNIDVVVDQPGTTAKFLGGVSFNQGTNAPPSTSIMVAAPPGGPFRVRARAIANRAGGTVPGPVLRDGETSTPVLAAGNTYPVTINLGDFQITVDPSTPTSSPVGAQIIFRFNINDPGETVEGQTFGLYVSPSVTEIAIGHATNLGFTTPVKVTTGIYTLTYQVTLPTTSPLLYYTVTTGYGPLGPNGYFAPPAGTTWQIAVDLPCAYTLAPMSAALPQGQTSGSFTVTTNEPACPWNAQSLAPWLTIFPSTTTGSGSLQYVAQANTGTASRTGMISVGDKTFTVTQVGTTGPPPAQAKVAILRNNNGSGMWVVDSNGDFAYEFSDQVRFFGQAGDQPVAGDWNGTGVVTIGVFRNGTWYLDLNNNGQWDGVAGGDGQFSFGAPGDIAVVGDWTGDHKSKLGIFRCPPAGTPGGCYFVLDAGAKFTYDPATALVLYYGGIGDLPAISKWSGADQPDRVGVYRNGLWIVDSNGDGNWEPSDTAFFFGIPGDIPVAGDWTGNGLKRIGIFRPSKGQWVLDVDGNNAFDATDLIVNFGATGDLPVVGNWTLP